MGLGDLGWLPMGYTETAINSIVTTFVSSPGIPPGAGGALIQVSGADAFLSFSTDPSSGGGMYLPDAIANKAVDMLFIAGTENLQALKLFGTAAGRLRVQFFQHR